jgi:hypothetical protein
MLEDFRAQANASSFDNDDQQAYEEPVVETRRHFLGMSPVQRFVIALMLLFLVCLLGSFFLLVTEKIVLPFI